MAHIKEVDATDGTAKLSYSEFLQNFGAAPIDQALLERFEAVTGQRPHRFLRRGLFFCHRDLDRLLTAYEKHEPIYIYTGRGPSSEALHLGHVLPFIFVRWLQQVLGCIVVVQITDDEKFLRDKSLSFEDVHAYAKQNIRDIIACGFEPANTFIFLNSSYMGTPNGYRLSCIVERMITCSQLKAAFGAGDATSVGYFSFPPRQMLPVFPEYFPGIDFRAGGKISDDPARPFPDNAAAAASVPADTATQASPACPTESVEAVPQDPRAHAPTAKKANKPKKPTAAGARPGPKPLCLIACGMEQDPYFRVARDLQPRLDTPKLCIILGKFIPALQGPDTKMSASDPNNAIYLTDTPAQIKKKINKYAFSGGRATIEEHRALGADLSVDVPIKYLEVFMEDDAELERIKTEYGAGRLLTGEVKQTLISILCELVSAHRERRDGITDAMVAEFMRGYF